MALERAWNAYIFRDGKSAVRGMELVDGLVRGLREFGIANPIDKRSELIDLLMRAGELECALRDAASEDGEAVAAITDALADVLVRNTALDARELLRRAAALSAPDEVKITPPEGFAYYSLHPLDFADLVRSLEALPREAAVIGIRSIGTTLSAVVQAALRGEGARVERCTVRPTGHPYDRRTEFTAQQLRWIARMRARGTEFLVVDEGPGMSGSSFLSVGEALMAAGVLRERITFLCSRDAHSSSLNATDAATRWPAFRRACVSPTKHLPKRAKHFVAGGIWRAHVFAREEDWPASWLQMERLKFLSSEKETIFKFEGFGRFGRAVHERAKAVAEAGFGPRPIGFEEGFGVYPMLRGRTLFDRDATGSALRRMAVYCAFRARAMKVNTCDTAELEKMSRFNAGEEFGVELPREVTELRVERPTICDGRMLPHKWMEVDGHVLKLDAAVHGDDHFFPGPCDIAWDLAGCIVEWNLGEEGAQFFLNAYCEAVADAVTERLPAYLLAYAVFRMAYCKMATASMQGAEEEHRLRRDYFRYRAQALRLVERTTKVGLAATARQVA